MRCLIPAILIVITVLANSALATDSSVPFILADLVHAQKITGQGVTVAVIDAGVDYADHGLVDL